MIQITIRTEHEAVPHPISASELSNLWAEQPDMMALTGIWEGKEIAWEELGSEAWEPADLDDLDEGKNEFLQTSAPQNQVFSKDESGYFKSDFSGD
ncbi:MAG: hypothetical protein AAB316_08370 [Bacteroidota bacterium]